MARYIDADALNVKVDLSTGARVVDMAIAAIRAINEAPAADVVPRSEVERLSAIIWRLKQENLLPVHSMIKNARLEVAREIFEEIDSMIFGTIIPNDCAIISVARLAELKKKYTNN